MSSTFPAKGITTLYFPCLHGEKDYLKKGMLAYNFLIYFP